MLGTVHQVCRSGGQRDFVGIMKYFRHICLWAMKYFLKFLMGHQTFSDVLFS